MLIVILVIQIITLLAVLGLVGAVSDLKPQRKTGSTFLDDDVFGEDFIETPQKPKVRTKQAVKKTTTLRKRGDSAKVQKRAANGRFA